MKDERQNPLLSGVHTRGYLPHVKREGFEREKAERLRRLRHFKHRAEAVNDSEEEIARDFGRKIERYLDRGVGACHLRRPDIADLVANAMRTSTKGGMCCTNGS